MKTLKNLKPALFNATILVAFLFAFSSCGETKKADEEEDSKEVAEETNEENFETKASEKDAQFLVNVAEKGMEEVKLAQLALAKSSNADVKELAMMLETAHTKANNEIKELALKKGIAIPNTLTEDSEDAHKKLNEKEGRKFDKEYCDMMVKAHENAIENFEKASKEATDIDIKNWAANMLPILNTHLEQAKACKEKCDKMK